MPPKILDILIYVSNIDHKRIALGSEEGLFVVHVTLDGKESVYCSGITLNSNNNNIRLFSSFL